MGQFFVQISRLGGSVLSANQQQVLFITKEHFQLEFGNQNQLVEKGPGYHISVGDFRHFPVDTLMQPSEHDDMYTGLGIQI